MIVLGVFLTLSAAVVFWAIKSFKSSAVRSYQSNELGIADPISNDLKSLAKKLALLEDERELTTKSKTVENIQQSIEIKKKFICIGRELMNLEREGSNPTETSYEQKT